MAASHNASNQVETAKIFVAALEIWLIQWASKYVDLHVDKLGFTETACQHACH
jgi:hypothetical protein